MSAPPTAYDLSGQVAIVTGSGHGIGRNIAEELALCGARVLLNGRDPGRVEETAHYLRGQGAEVANVIGDVSQSSVANALAAAAIERWGRIDVLVNNAGINAIRPSVELSDDDWEAVIGVDLSAPFYCSRAVAPTMLRQGSGCIVNISSILGITAFGQRAAYASAKHGLIGLTRVLAVEWGPQGVRVNAVLPGMIDVKDKDRTVMKVDDSALIARTPMRRFGEPEEVGRLCCYLASADGTFVSGAIISIDGAWTAYGGW